MRTLAVHNVSRNGALVLRARACDSFLCRLRGLTFRSRLPAGEGLLLVEGAESRLGAAIHMWMVFMPLGVAWLDAKLSVVDVALARPWRIYWPARPAQYILEGRPAMLQSVAVGDQLAFDESSPRPPACP